jgi:poly-gamma-glutamate capsule biosynthesis protein CapA/YwtB (metallophosphatase superfamily)
METEPEIPMPSPAPLPPAAVQPPKKSHKKLVLIIIGVLVVLLLVGGGGAFYLKKHSKAVVTKTTSVTKAGNSTTVAPAAKDAHPNRIRLLATGDFIAHDSVNSNAKQADGTYNYLPMMQDFVPVLAKADVRFCNDPILNGGAAFGIAGYPKFNSPTAFVTDMGKLGCNVVNMASNHSFDKNQDAISASVAAWDSVPNLLAVAGQNRNQTEHDTVHYFTVKGVKFAFLAYTAYINADSPVQNSYGVNVYSQSFAGSQIAEAKKNGAQVIIVSMRWGTEYSAAVNAEQQTDAQFLANQGVSLILGHGPHVLQTTDQLKGTGGNVTDVWYSLGNFINTQLETEALFNGLAVIDYDTTTHQITKEQYLPLYMHYEWTAVQSKAQDLASRKNLHLYLLDDTTQAMIDSNQLFTTAAAQKTRIQTLLNKNVTIPMLTKADYLAQ